MPEAAEAAAKVASAPPSAPPKHEKCEDPSCTVDHDHGGHDHGAPVSFSRIEVHEFSGAKASLPAFLCLRLICPGHDHGHGGEKCTVDHDHGGHDHGAPVSFSRIEVHELSGAKAS